MSRSPLLLLLASLLFATAACSEPAPQASAVTGTACEHSGDCSGGQVCDSGSKLCVQKLDSKDASISLDSSIDSGAQTDANQGGDGSGSDGSGSDGSGTTDQDAPAPTDSKADAVAPVSDKSCATCTADADCGADFECVDLLNGKFCARKCTVPADCKAGYSCEKASSGGNSKMNCVLPSFQCEGCAGTGCGAGQKCNLKSNPPACGAVKTQCEDCQLDSDCDGGLRCVKQGKSKVCAPDCSATGKCPDKSTCQSFLGVSGKVCAFQAATCCFGPACTTSCPGCSADKCIGGQCVECVLDSDCGKGKCNLASHTCASDAACSAPTPIKLSSGTCVECNNDSHCAQSSGGPKCNLSNNKCEKSSASNECANCGGNYPDCVDINGTWSCVECKSDTTCEAKKAGTCSPTKFTCAGTVGAGTGPSKGTCKSDSECVNGPSTTFDLACDTASGLCFDKKGNCDNVAAFCNAAAGSSCKQMADLLGGAGGLPGGIPGLPSGGGSPGGLPGGGYCSCGGTASGGGSGSKMKQECQLFAAIDPKLKNCKCEVDPANPDCKNALLGDCCTAPSSGGGSTPTNPLQCLLTSGAGQPAVACFGGKCSEALSCITGKPGGSCAKFP